jgi:hypothetical protein
MTVALLIGWLAGALASPLQLPPPSDLHIVFRFEFVYQASTRTTSNEWWVSDGKSAARQGDRLSIYREDLGVVWRASVKAGTYTETKIPVAGQPAPTPLAAGKVDMHTAGYDWEPIYDWSVKASGQSSIIAGRPCREFVATGDADYAEAKVSFWACDPLPGVTRNPTDTVAAPLRSASAKKMILDTLTKHGGAWLLAAEEQQEPAIAPTMVMRVRVETLEVTTAPPGTFDVPPTFKKVGP